MTDDTTTKDTRTVKVLAFTYAKVHDNPYDPDGPKIVENTVAQRGDELVWDDLTDYDKNRADKFDVFYTDEEAQRLQPDGTLAEPEDMSSETIVLGENSTVEELADWIREDQPTIDEVVELAGDNPALAQKLIQAESAATGGDPRRTLVTRLEKVN
jgi:hypothetical protein